MNWKRINEILRKRKIVSTQFKHINCVRIHQAEEMEHFMKKCEVCFNLFKQGFPFLIEVWTADGKRFDILDLENDLIYEVSTGKSKAKKSYKADIEILA